MQSYRNIALGFIVSFNLFQLINVQQGKPDVLDNFSGSFSQRVPSHHL